MSYKVVEKFTPEMENKDYVVFLKTNFQSPILNAKGNIVAWKQDADNYTYALFPNRRVSKKSMMAESYMKPEGEITCWKDKLPKVETMELDALTEDLPATWFEFSDLLAKLAVDNRLSDGTIVIEDATTWQKLRTARKKLLRKEFEKVCSPISGTLDREDSCFHQYPLYGFKAM